MKRKIFGGIENTKKTDFALALLRVFIGLSIMLVHGASKVPVSDKFIGYIDFLGFPFPAVFAWMAALSEYIGALFLALGLFTRPASILVASTMFIAIVLVHAADPFETAEKAYLYFAFSTLFVVIGSGRFSMDSIIRRKLNIF